MDLTEITRSSWKFQRIFVDMVGRMEIISHSPKNISSRECVPPPSLIINHEKWSHQNRWNFKRGQALITLVLITCRAEVSRRFPSTVGLSQIPVFTDRWVMCVRGELFRFCKFESGCKGDGWFISIVLNSKNIIFTFSTTNVNIMVPFLPSIEESIK